MTDAQTLELIEPTEALKDDFLAMAAEYLQSGTNFERILYGRAAADFAGYLQQCRQSAAGVETEPGIVPESTYWLVRGGKRIVAVSRLRHELTPLLLREGGHIGYGTRPSERGKGYGKEICRLTLQKARLMGMQRVLITCNSQNAASARIIEANGGVLENQLTARDGTLRSRYWVEL